MNFPTLYKKTNTGAIQFWYIGVEDNINHSGWALIETTYGQNGTDNPQTTQDIISEGKNIGKSNETTAFEQAIAEAKAKWEKQKKKGYVESIEAAEKGELDELIRGGVNVMLAKSYAKDGNKIKYPAYISPKLDGLRCVAIVENGKCTLWSRTRKLIKSMPEITKALTGLSYNAIFDGEIYSNSHSNNFEEIVSLVRQETPNKNSSKLQYHIFDLVNSDPYRNRLRDLKIMVSYINSPYILTVESNLVENEEEALNHFQTFVDKKFEGAMIRNRDSFYVGKRSADLQKIKEFEDAEFEIVDIEEGRGKLAGHVGAFVCLTPNGQKFKAKMSGNIEKLKEYLENDALWKGKFLTVQYQAFTSYGIPRFPVGKAIRDYE